MVAGSILPIAIKKNKLYLLFGKENPMEDSAKGWSDFGGRCDNNETPYQAALREGSEELTGFLGNPQQLKQLIEKRGPTYNISHNNYHVHIFVMDYDENLPMHYNNNHSFLWDNMDKHLLNDSKLFEKIEIDWFSKQDLTTRRNEFRGFYREIVDIIKKEMPNIMKFAKKSHNNNNNSRYTRKMRK